jgi:hypothetical protein
MLVTLIRERYFRGWWGRELRKGNSGDGGGGDEEN